MRLEWHEKMDIYQWEATFDQEANNNWNQRICECEKKKCLINVVRDAARTASTFDSQNKRMNDGQLSPPSRPFNTMSHCSGSTRMPYLIRFSNSKRKPPIVNSRKPQLTRPVKSWKPELHENSESLGRWHLQWKEKKKKRNIQNNGIQYAIDLIAYFIVRFPFRNADAVTLTRWCAARTLHAAARHLCPKRFHRQTPVFSFSFLIWWVCGVHSKIQQNV